MRTVFKKALIVFMVLALAMSMTAVFASAAEEGAAGTEKSFLERLQEALPPNGEGGIMATVNALFEFLAVELPQMLTLGIIVLGLLQCLFGYKILRFEVFLLGCAVGAVAGYFLNDMLLASLTANMPIIGYLVMVLLALLVGWLVARLFRFVMFLLIAAASFVVGSAVLAPMIGNMLPSLAENQMILTLISVLFSIIVAAIVIKLRRPALIILTALLGAFLAGFLGLNILMYPAFKISLVATAALFVLGLIFQFRGARRSSPYSFSTAMILGGLIASSANNQKDDLARL